MRQVEADLGATDKRMSVGLLRVVTTESIAVIVVKRIRDFCQVMAGRTARSVIME